MVRISTIGPETKNKLLMYFNGELDHKIKKFYKKKNQKWPDEYYCTIGSLSYVGTRNDTNNIADPTGGRAVKLAELNMGRGEKYNYYKQLKETIDKEFQKLNDDDVYLIKVALKVIEENITEASNNLNSSYNKTRRRIEELIINLDRKISGVGLHES